MDKWKMKVIDVEKQMHQPTLEEAIASLTDEQRIAACKIIAKVVEEVDRENGEDEEYIKRDVGFMTAYAAVALSKKEEKENDSI